MTSDNRGVLVVKLHKKIFDTEPTYFNAREVFLACRRYETEIPEGVLAVITAKLSEEHEQEMDSDFETSRKIAEKTHRPQTLLQLALEKDSLKEAFDTYKKLKVSDDTHGALRKTLERYLDQQLEQLADAGQIQRICLQSAKLTEKLDIYKEILSTL